MAFAKTIISQHGLEVVNAYHRVENVIFVSKTEMSFNVRVYKDEAADLSAIADKGFKCAYDHTKTNPYVQAYEYLKTLPDFAGATDC
jgi:hypothetical protein